jgi:hypothetical protein
MSNKKHVHTCNIEDYLDEYSLSEGIQRLQELEQELRDKFSEFDEVEIKVEKEYYGDYSELQVQVGRAFTKEEQKIKDDRDKIIKENVRKQELAQYELLKQKYGN